MRRFGFLGAAFALLVAGSLTVVAPAGGVEAPPTLEHCWWWPGDTVVHWDNAWLEQRYDISKYGYGAPGRATVKAVEFHWSHVLAGRTWRVDNPPGDTVRATTPIQAQDVYAVLFLENGNTVHTNTQSCVFH